MIALRLAKHFLIGSFSMHMAEVRSYLEKRGLPRITAASIRFAELTGRIPRVPRDWRGFRSFTAEHLNALEQHFAPRKEPPQAIG
jgi:hypothetical protein